MDAQQTLAQWRADEDAVRRRLSHDSGSSLHAQLAGKSGMDIFNAIFAGEIATPPMGDTLDFIPIRMEPGTAIFQGQPQRRHYNPMGIVHGGWFATMLDSCVGCAVLTMLPAGKGFTTLELKVNMIRAITDAIPLIRAEGHVIHVGGQVATAEGRLVGPDGKLYAHATTTCLVFDVKSRS